MKIYGLESKAAADLLIKGDLSIAVYGMGKMGLPLAAIFADVGARVIGADINTAVVASINQGTNHVKEEPGLDELVSKNVKNNRLSASTDLVDVAKKADVHIILVPTLLCGDEVDLSPVKSCAESISSGLEKGDIVITECTMPPGSTESLISALKGSNLIAGSDFGLAHCPERTMTGTAIRDIRGQYPKIIGCINNETTKPVKGIYSVINSKGVISVSDIKTAECVKVFEGIYRDVNIALANELTFVCERLCVNAVEAFNTANTQPYSNIHMPGSVGGHCIPVYPYFVMDSDTELVRRAREVNDSIAGKLVGKASDLLESSGKQLSGSNVLVLGLSFRGGVKETINSLSLDLFRILSKRNANVFCFDPLYLRGETEAFNVQYKNDYEGIDCIIIASDHVEFKNLKWDVIASEMRSKVVVDGRQIIDISKLRDLGFICYSLGVI